MPVIALLAIPKKGFIKQRTDENKLPIPNGPR